MEYTYAVLLLNETGAEINEQNLTTTLESTGFEPSESRVKAIIAALEDVDIEEAVAGNFEPEDEFEEDDADAGEGDVLDDNLEEDEGVDADMDVENADEDEGNEDADPEGEDEDDDDDDGFF